MEAVRSYPVIFKRGEVVIFETIGTLESTEGEPHDTATVFHSALIAFIEAKKAGKLPKDAVKICDHVLIEQPDGSRKSFSDDEIEQILDQDVELRKIKATDDLVIVVSVEGGISGGDMGEPIEVSISKLSTQDRVRVEAIIDLIQARKPAFTYDKNGWVGDFGHYVRIGSPDQKRWEKTMIFAGGFRQTPREVEELQRILETYRDC